MFDEQWFHQYHSLLEGGWVSLVGTDNDIDYTMCWGTMESSVFFW